MDFFWGNVFDYYKDRRFVPVFFVTLVVLFAGPLVIGLILGLADAYDLLKYWPFVVTVIISSLLVSIVRAVQRERARRKDRYKIAPLSRDELNKARSKLMNNKR
jgi:membrane protein implicated in regulation of membrane protease activity